MLSSPKTVDIHGVLSHLVVEDALRGAQQAGSLRAVSSRRFQRIKDEIFLIGGNRFAERKTCEGARSLCSLKGRRQMMSMDDGSVTDQHGAFNDVLELTHVAGPVIGREHIYRGCGDS